VPASIDLSGRETEMSSEVSIIRTAGKERPGAGAILGSIRGRKISGGIDDSNPLLSAGQSAQTATGKESDREQEYLSDGNRPTGRRPSLLCHD
jgi:hypothetical protein